MISASGIPHIIKASWIKENAVCIDVGISPIIGIDRKPGITGDFEFIQEWKNARLVTPVPGGLGPITVSAMMQN